MSKYYQTLLDRSWKGKEWFSGERNKRKLTDEEAKPLLEKEEIKEVDMSPKKFVILDGKEMTWGAYLKYRRSFNK